MQEYFPEDLVFANAGTLARGCQLPGECADFIRAHHQRTTGNGDGGAEWRLAEREDWKWRMHAVTDKFQREYRNSEDYKIAAVEKTLGHTYKNF